MRKPHGLREILLKAKEICACPSAALDLAERAIEMAAPSKKYRDLAIKKFYRSGMAPKTFAELGEAFDRAIERSPHNLTQRHRALDELAAESQRLGLG